jgi:hypothetical protein
MKTLRSIAGEFLEIYEENGIDCFYDRIFGITVERTGFFCV